jgi:hypothetical protein
MNSNEFTYETIWPQWKVKTYQKKMLTLIKKKFEIKYKLIICPAMYTGIVLIKK